MSASEKSANGLPGACVVMCFMSMPKDAHSLFRPAPGTRPTPIILDRSQLRWQRGDCLFIWFSLNTYFGFLRAASVTRHMYPSAHIMVKVIGGFWRGLSSTCPHGCPFDMYQGG